MINEKLNNYVKAFKDLEVKDKEVEIINHIKELIDFISNEETGDFKEEFESLIYDNKEDFLNDMFIYIIYLKELIGSKYL